MIDLSRTAAVNMLIFNPLRPKNKAEKAAHWPEEELHISCCCCMQRKTRFLHVNTTFAGGGLPSPLPHTHTPTHTHTHTKSGKKIKRGECRSPSSRSLKVCVGRSSRRKNAPKWKCWLKCDMLRPDNDSAVTSSIFIDARTPFSFLLKRRTHVLPPFKAPLKNHLLSERSETLFIPAQAVWRHDGASKWEAVENQACCP